MDVLATILGGFTGIFASMFVIRWVLYRDLKFEKSFLDIVCTFAWIPALLISIIYLLV